MTKKKNSWLQSIKKERGTTNFISLRYSQACSWALRCSWSRLQNAMRLGFSSSNMWQFGWLESLLWLTAEESIDFDLREIILQRSLLYHSSVEAQTLLAMSSSYLPWKTHSSQAPVQEPSAPSSCLTFWSFWWQVWLFLMKGINWWNISVEG